ncbi:tetraacyldisaccharide 4'-kinase [Pseudodesulfovibrio cashew]|uniref:Tetraacyldisaccharide 4'-kinase n=1 Tax=Pseudodesulfovibrio cashew TaxID=2678688 RepID=A0A6I6JFL1_9BACT|nr:tetraacyldisaccharide 4'-kinase [Pseudodesulfovibrio cashew]QGY38797.1 tetraacyldisaccharide 4'-kinase [Pseudodesulfovibrio cashew]
MTSTVTSLQHAFGPVLKPAAWANGKVMRLREWLYRRGLKPSWRPAPVTVSVGNIGWGGSGKTPIAGWLLDWAEANRKTALLLTRGYRAKPERYPYLVRPGALAEEAGDEPLMLACDHPKAHVVVDPVRKRGGRWGVKRFKPDLIVLDDGFQHMAVRRHSNLVLLKPEDLGEQWNRLIPAGSWREPASALARADAFLMKVGPKNFHRVEPRFKQLLGHLRKPLFTFQVVPTGIRQVTGGAAKRDFDNENYLLVSGVGDPALVERTATRHFGYKPVKHLIYRDHHAFTKADVNAILAAAQGHGCEAILCTPKDAVKLGPLCNKQFWQFDLRVEFGPSTIGPKATFAAWWPRHFERLRTLSAVHGPQSRLNHETGDDNG